MALPSSKEPARLLLHPLGGRTSTEAQAVAHAERDAQIGRVAGPLREFTALVGASGLGPGPERAPSAPVARFEDWLARAAACGVAALATFASGLRQDGAALRAGRASPPSAAAPS